MLNVLMVWDDMVQMHDSGSNTMQSKNDWFAFYSTKMSLKKEQTVKLCSLNLTILFSIMKGNLSEFLVIDTPQMWKPIRGNLWFWRYEVSLDFWFSFRVVKVKRNKISFNFTSKYWFFYFSNFSFTDVKPCKQIVICFPIFYVK